MALITFLVSLFYFTPSSAIERPLSFQKALSEISNRDPRIASKKSLLRSANTNVLSKRLTFLPSLRISGSEQTFHSDPKTSSTQGQAELQFNLTEKLANFAALSSSENEYLAALAEERKQQLTTELSAVSALIELITQSKQLEIVRADLDAKEQTSKVAKQRFRQGRTSEEDWLKSTVELANAQSRLAQAEARYDVAESEVSFLLGHTNVEKTWPLKDFFLNSPVIKTPDFIAEEIPSIQSKTFSKNAATDKINIINRNRLPQLDLFVSRGYSDINKWSTVSGVRIGFTLFDGYKESAQLQTQKVLAEVADNDLQLETRKLRSRHAGVKNSFLKNLEGTKRRNKTNQLVQRLYKTDFKRFQHGRKSFSELTIDQRRVFETQRATLLSWQRVHLDYTKLCHSAGKALNHCR